MIRLTPDTVASGTGGICVQAPTETAFTSVSIDTRTLDPGALFFAIRGPSNDGHRFIPDALEKGALGIVADRNVRQPDSFPEGCALFQVKDTHQALKSLAHSVRNRWNGDLAAITGSMGKTTTRQFAAQLLAVRLPVYQTPGNYNNLFGLPLALFGLDDEVRVGIFEMGMSAAGEISEMCRIARPSIGILTNVAPVHLEFFDSLESIAQAKAELVESLPVEGTLIYNIDDPHVRAIATRFGGRKISFGTRPDAEVQATAIRMLGPEKTAFTLGFDGQTAEAQIPFAGAHYVLNALPGIALCRLYGTEMQTIVENLKTLKPAAMRGGILHFKEGFHIIDDSYNSNPRALGQMIDVLAEMPYFSRRILVAGEMRELGKSSPELHFECGGRAAQRGVDVVIGVRGDAEQIVRGAMESGMDPSRAHFFEDSEAAATFVTASILPGDLVLIKGSRSVHSEKIVHALCARFELQHD